MKTSFRLLIGAGLAVSALRPAVASAPATFEQTPVGSAPSGWSCFGLASWTIVPSGPALAYQATGSAAPGPFASTRPVDGSGDSFTVSTTFRLERATAHPSGEYIGLVAFATVPNLAAAGYYVADVQRGSGILRIISLGGENPDFSSPGNGEAFVGLREGADYTFTLAASRPGGVLTLAFTLSDGVGSTTIVATDPTPLAGKHFGFRLNNTSADDPLHVRFGDFTVTPLASSER